MLAAMNTLLIAALLAPGLALAQTSSPPVLESLIKSAKQHLASSQALREKEAQKGKDFDPCVADLVSLQETYDLWFTRHEADFTALRNSVLSELKGANERLKALRSTTVTMNAVEGQTTAKVTITLEQLIAYFANLNERLEGISPEKRALLMKTQENPNLNPLKLAHSQVLEAMKLMTVTLNASLKEQNSQYEIGFTATERKFTLEYRVILPIAGKRVGFDIPLFGSATLDFSLSEAQLWNRLSREQILIDGQPIDGRARYRAFRDQHADKKCIEDKRIVFPGTSIGVPYATYDEAMQGSLFATQRYWDQIPVPNGVIAQEVAVGTDGTVYILCPADLAGLRTIYRKAFSAPDWSPVVKGAVQQIAVGLSDQIFAVGTNGNVYRNLSGEKGWSYYGGRRTSRLIALDSQGRVHTSIANRHLGLTTVNSESYQISGNADLLSFAIVGSRYYSLEKSGEIRIGGFDGRWEPNALPKPPAPAVELAVSSDESIFILADNGSVYAYADGFWTLVTESLSADAKIISIATNSQGQVAGIDAKGRVYALKEKQQ